MMVRNLPINIIFLVITSVAISTIASLNAQELPANIRNMLTAEQLEEFERRSDQVTQTEGNNNLPVSKMPEQPNSRVLTTNDATDKSLEETKIEPQKIISKAADKSSLINRYYEILTQEPLDIFGKEAFVIEKNKNDILFFNTPGKDYQLAAGDVVQVITRGLSVINEEVQVDNLGRLTLPIIAPFMAHGKTVNEVKEHVLQELKTEDASASVYVNLSAARLIQVKVTGEVIRPQTVAVPAYTPLTQVLSNVGGISEIGSLRNILVINSQQEKERVDLYRLLRESQEFKEPLITSGSRVHVNDIGSTVAVSGFVGRPRIFELPYGVNQISASELIKLANARLTPSGTTFELLKFDNNGMVHSTNFKSTQELFLNEGEALRIKFPNVRNLQEVAIEGEVIKPFSLITNDNGTSLRKALKNGAVLNKNAIMRSVLVFSNTIHGKDVKIIDLRKIFTEDHDFLVYPGEIIKILDQKSFKDTLKNVKKDIVFNNTSLILIDDEIVALVPDHPKQSMDELIKSQIILNEDVTKDFALITSKGSNGEESLNAFNLGNVLKSSNSMPIPDNTEINLFTKQYLSKKLNSLDELLIEDDKISRIRKTNPVEIFVDGKRLGVLPAGTMLSDTELIKELRINKGLYPLFARITDNDLTATKIKKTFNDVRLSNLLYDDLKFKTKQGQRIDIFSTRFVRSLFSRNESDSVISLKLSDSEADKDIISDTDISSDFNLSTSDRTSENVQTTKYNLAALKRASRLVTGAVANPGFYPIAENVPLSDLIDAAGGALPGSDLSRINIRKYEIDAEGISDLSDVIILDADSIDISNFILSGNFDVTIPNFVNNAAVGMVNISGEVLRPGEYLISRDETFLQVINRAGGLTDVAYPLGINFSRKALKEQEQQTNLVLANKIEQSILSLSQSKQEGAGDQINAILIYARQLRSIPVSGRQTINYAELANKNKILLEDGDNIFIPKRPSHVSISGRVQNPTIAIYSKDKKFKDYIDDAGGLERIADEKNIFITLPNGQSLTQKTLKNHGDIIPPGSIIIVPPKTDKLSLLGLTEVFSKVLGNIATSILAINAVSN